MDLNKPINLHITDNPLKTSFAWNALAISGFVPIAWVLCVIIYIAFESKGDFGILGLLAEALIMLWVIPMFVFPFEILAFLFVLAIELLIKKKLNFKFFRENKFYNLIFYTGLSYYVATGVLFCWWAKSVIK